MQPQDGVIRKFKLDPMYPHNRSEGTTRRRNRGTRVMEEQREAYEDQARDDLRGDF